MDNVDEDDLSLKFEMLIDHIIAKKVLSLFLGTFLVTLVVIG